MKTEQDKEEGMSQYSPEEQAAYDIGFRIGKSLGAIGVEFSAVSKKKWTEAYRNQIDELIKENELLTAAQQPLVDAIKTAKRNYELGYIDQAFRILDAALAKVKEGK